MKRSVGLLILLCFISLEAVFAYQPNPPLEIQPNKPSDGQTINLTYSPQSKNYPDRLHAYIYHNYGVNDTRVRVVSMTMQEGKGKITYQLPNGVKSFLIIIRDSLKVYDNNQGKGFPGIIYKDGQPLPEGMGFLADMYSGWRSHAYKIDRNFGIALSYFNDAFKVKQELKRRHRLNYLYCLQDVADAKYLFEEELKEYAEYDSLTADEYLQIAEMYRKSGNAVQSAYFKRIRLEKFPEDKNVINNVTSSLYNTFYQSRDFNFKKKLYYRFAEDYSFVTSILGRKAVNQVKGIC